MAVPVKRLLKRQNFLALKKEGLRVNTQSFVLQYMPMPGQVGVFVGFTTSGALGNAVHRNRARRRLKAAFDAALRLNPYAQAPNLHMVIVGKMPIFDIQYDYLLKDMTKALAEAGVTWAK
jgi:ribonuclease P protein component